jgi:DMSO/TMAO reductase YedYZ heme-binding membrane subunit
MKSEFWWYVARSGGVVAWGLATISVVWGLMLSTRVLGRRVTLAKLLDLHRFLGGLSVVFVLVHVLGLWLEDSLPFGLVDLLVPMASAWEPGAVAWGVVAFYLLVAVEITSLLRSSISENLWRNVHYLGFAVFLFGTIHGLKAGTDVQNPLIWWPAAIASAAVVGLCAHRILNGEEMRIAPRSDRVPRAVLEKTLTELERFDTEAYPPAPAAQTVSPERIFEPLSELSLRPTLQPDPTVQRVAESVAERLAEAAPSRPPVEPPFPSIEPAAFAERSVELAPHVETPAVEVTPSSPVDDTPAIDLPVPSRTTASETLLARSLPTRTPKRFDATTAPGALGVWTPASRPVHEEAGGPPPPPEAVDPSTGDPDPQAYRKWLREWLAYVESQP